MDSDDDLTGGDAFSRVQTGPQDLGQFNKICVVVSDNRSLA